MLLSCGSGDGGSSPTPPDSSLQTVLVQVTTTGDDIDADGYTVRLGTRTAAVSPTGTATFNDVPAGTHEVRLEGVAQNCSVQGGATQSVNVTSSAGAQASFTVVCLTQFGDGLETVACQGLALAAGSGLPMERIGAGTVPNTLNLPLAARVRTADGTLESYTYFDSDDQGRLEMVAPLHPSGGLEGGEVLIRVTDGTVACEPFQFTIDDLPPSPGEWGAVVSLLQEALRTQAAIFETTPDEIIATPFEELDRVLIPMAIVQYVLDHPANDRSFTRIADGTAGVAVPLDLMESILARTGVRNDLESTLSSAQGVAAAPAANIGTQTCLPGTIGTTETLILSDCMNAQAEAARLLAGHVGRVIEQLNDGIWLAQGLPGAAGGGASWLAALLWILETEEVRTAALLPCCFVDMEYEADPLFFEEDHPGTGTWYASVVAVNQGYDLGREVLQALLTFSNAAAAFDGVDVGGPNVSNIIQSVVTGPLAEYLLDEGTFDAFMIPIETFGPVPIFQDDWAEVVYIGAGVDSTTHNKYEPVEVGTTTIEVSTRPGADEPLFGRKLISKMFEVRVDSIIIFVEPADTFVGPSDVKTFRITLLDSYFPDSIQVSAQQGMVELELNDVQDMFDSFALYQAPANASFDNPDEIEVRHIGMTGARENGPLRLANATVRFGKVEISPEAVCVETSEEVQLSAEVEGPEDKTVTWTADVGTIDDDGNYRAPAVRPASGFATIRATSTEHPALLDEVKVAIGCTCFYSFNFGGQTYSPEPGDILRFSDWGGPDQPYGNNYEFYSIYVRRPSTSWTTYTLPLEDDPSTWPGIGTTDGRVQGSFGLLEQWEILYASDDDEGPAQITLDEYVPETMVRGSVNSVVRIISTQPPFGEEVTLNWSFTVTVPPGYQRGGPGAFGYTFQCTVGG